MRPKLIDIDLDAMDRDGIAQAQNTTASTALTLNGALGTTLDYARIIGIYSAANFSGGTFTIVGTDANGNSITESGITGPNNSTVVSTKLFKTITSVTPSATVASDVEVGTVATTLSAESHTIPLDFYQGLAPTIAVDVTGTINFTVYETFVNVLAEGTSAAVWNSISALASKTADTTAQCTVHATALKIQVNSYSSGAELQMRIISGNR